jgi:hypothetical protein
MKNGHVDPAPSALSAMVLLGQLGLAMSVPIVGGVWLGIFLDERLGLSGLCTLLGVGVGVASGFFGVYSLLQREIPWKR